jgi:uncharacterized damage-inducible protein DinB
MTDKIISSDLLSEQYQFIKGSREVVFNFCEKFDPSDYIKEVEGFGRGSICSTQIHIANTYTYWVANALMEKSLGYIKYEPNNIETVRKAFDAVNSFIEEFINEYGENINQIKKINIPNKQDQISISFLQVFTHTVTHEFHHKGQIMSMGRILGYIPPDADIIRFS